MKAVLMSIQPKFCELIASGKKTVEVRKTKPKLDVPFKVYIYETQGRTETPFVDEEGHHIFKGRGQVIGEFVCDRFTFLDAYYDANGNRHLCNTAFVKSCVPDDELFDYIYGKHAGNHGGWAWHITDLVIYDKPRELGEFVTAKEIGGYEEIKPITRPFQSWGYVYEAD